jgi:hypothetical protein
VSNGGVAARTRHSPRRRRSFRNADRRSVARAAGGARTKGRRSWAAGPLPARSGGEPPQSLPGSTARGTAEIPPPEEPLPRTRSACAPSWSWASADALWPTFARGRRWAPSPGGVAARRSPASRCESLREPRHASPMAWLPCAPRISGSGRRPSRRGRRSHGSGRREDKSGPYGATRPGRQRLPRCAIPGAPSVAPPRSAAPSLYRAQSLATADRQPQAQATTSRSTARPSSRWASADSVAPKAPSVRWTGRGSWHSPGPIHTSAVGPQADRSNLAAPRVRDDGSRCRAETSDPGRDTGRDTVREFAGALAP